MLSAMKETMFDWKTDRLKKQAAQLQTKNEKLVQHIAELQGGNVTETMVPTRKNDDESKKKRIYKEPPVEPNKGENRQSKNRSKITPEKHESNSETKELCEKRVKPMHSMNKRPIKRSAKRCHFCRKRGHIQKECPSRQVLQNWLWNDEVDEHTAEMQGVKNTGKVAEHTAEMPGVEDTAKVCEHTTET